MKTKLGVVLSAKNSLSLESSNYLTIKILDNIICHLVLLNLPMYT